MSCVCKLCCHSCLFQSSRSLLRRDAETHHGQTRCQSRFLFCQQAFASHHFLSEPALKVGTGVLTNPAGDVWTIGKKELDSIDLTSLLVSALIVTDTILFFIIVILLVAL